MSAPVAEDAYSEEDFDGFAMIVEGAESQCRFVIVERRMVPKFGDFTERHLMSMSDSVHEPDVSAKQVTCHD